MKKIFLLLFSATLLAPATGFAKEVVRLTSFGGRDISGVSAGSAFQVELVKTDKKSKNKAIVEIDKELEPYLKFERKSNGVVYVGLDRLPSHLQNNQAKRTMKLTLYLNRLDYVSLSGAGSLSAPKAVFEGKGLVIKTSGAAKISTLNATANSAKIESSGASELNLGISSPTLTINASGASRLKADAQKGVQTRITVSGAGDIRIAGSCQKATLSASGTSKIQAKEYTCDEADVKVSGSSAIYSVINGAVEATASGASKIDIQAKKGDKSTLSASGASDITIKGVADFVKMRTSGTSKINGKDYVCKEADVVSDGVSGVTIFVKNSIKVKATGSASVYYKGNPKNTDFTHSKSATIKPM